MDFDLKIGSTTYRARLPLFPRRYQVISAHGQHEARADMTDGEAMDLGYVQVGALGLCMVELPEGCPSFRDCDRDLVDFGEAVLDALMRLGHEPAEVMRAARDVLHRIYESIPTNDKIEEEAAPFVVPEDLSTVST